MGNTITVPISQLEDPISTQQAAPSSQQRASGTIVVHPSQLQDPVPGAAPSTGLPSAQPQPGALTRLWQGAVGEVTGAAKSLYGATVAPPDDAKEEMAASIGGPGGLVAYRAAKKVTDSVEGVFKGKSDAYQNFKQDALNSIIELHRGDWRNGITDAISAAAGSQGFVGSSDASTRARELIQGTKPGGDLATPVGKTVADLGMIAAGEAIGGKLGASGEAGDSEAAADAATHVYDPATKKITPIQQAPADTATPALNGTPIEQVAGKNAARAPISQGAPAVTEAEAPTVESLQPQIHQGVRDFVNKTAKANGLDPIPDSVPVTDAPQQLADALEARSKDTFNQVEKITGVNPTTLKEQMAARADQITEAAAAGDLEKAGNLQQLQTAAEEQGAKAFQAAKAKGVDVDQARADWNSSLRADELSAAVRGSKANTSTLQNPVLDPNKLTPRLQKLAESQPGGKAPKLFQLGGEDSATNLVQAAEQGRGAIQTFEPTTATGQQALAEILKPNTGSGYAGMGQLRSILGFKPTTNWIKSYADISKLSSEDLAARFGDEAPQAVSYVKKQAAWQVGKAVAKGATLLTLGQALGISPSILHAVVAQ